MGQYSGSNPKRVNIWKSSRDVVKKWYWQKSKGVSSIFWFQSPKGSTNIWKSSRDPVKQMNGWQGTIPAHCWTPPPNVTYITLKK